MLYPSFSACLYNWKMEMEKRIYFLITSQTVTFFKVRCVLFFCVGRDTEANSVLSI